MRGHRSSVVNSRHATSRRVKNCVVETAEVRESSELSNNRMKLTLRQAKPGEGGRG
jgi:hypothetical protein